MRILLLGAGGFIGRHILAELLAGGHDVVAVVRRRQGLDSAFPTVRFIEMDLAGAVRPADWAPYVDGVALVVNAAGLLRGKAMAAVHVAMPEALHMAARAAGVRRVILISAISARSDVVTDYARTKLAGEAALAASGLGWTILRPSLVYGDGSYGGTSLMRGMAGLPFVLPVPAKGDFAFTPIHVRDLARAVPAGVRGRTLRRPADRTGRAGDARSQDAAAPLPGLARLRRCAHRRHSHAADAPVRATR